MYLHVGLVEKLLARRRRSCRDARQGDSNCFAQGFSDDVGGPKLDRVGLSRRLGGHVNIIGAQERLVIDIQSVILYISTITIVQIDRIADYSATAVLFWGLPRD